MFWVHAGTRARFEEDYRIIAETTRLEGWDNSKADILRLVRGWLCDESNGRWVMIVDNADDSSVFFSPIDGIQATRVNGSYPPTQSLADFLPQSSNGSILITSRSREVAFRLTGSHADIIPANPMDQVHALVLLRKKLGDGFEQNDAVALVEALDYIPLAITQTAAYISERAPRITVSKYLQILKRGDRDKAKLLEKDVGDFRRDGMASNSVIATWQISFEHIREERPSAARLLSLMSLFDRQGIPESLLRRRVLESSTQHIPHKRPLATRLRSLMRLSDWQETPKFTPERTRRKRPLTTRLRSLVSRSNSLEVPESLLVGRDQGDDDARSDFEDDLHTLNNYSLITTDIEGGCFEMHRLVQFSTRKWLELRGELEHWKEKYVTLMDYSYPVGEYENRIICRALFPHAQAVIASRPTEGNALEAWASVLFKAAWYANDMGNYQTAKEMNQGALEARETVLGAKHPSTLRSMNSLASTYWNLGRWKEAEELFVQVMETSSKILGTEHSDTLTSMANLASTYQSQGRWKEAEKLEVQVLETRKRVLGPEHPDTLTSMANLASTYQNQGRWKEAEELFMQVVETSSRMLGAEHPNTLINMASLASTYSNQGRWKEAEELFVQVMETSSRVLGSEHPLMLTSMANLASTYWNQRRWKEAEKLFIQVVETSSRMLGAEHPNTLTSMNNLAFTFKSQGRKEEAISLMEKCLQLRQKVLGLQHHDAASSRGALIQWGDGTHETLNRYT